jgi:hypothetical protein
VSHPRSEMRGAVRVALAALPGLTGVTIYRSWAQSIGGADLPAIGVATPRETVRGATGNTVDRQTDLVVQYIQAGGEDLDDHLDDISALIEPVVLEALADFELFEMTSTDVDISGDGERLVGRLSLTFTATRYTPEGQAA